MPDHSRENGGSLKIVSLKARALARLACVLATAAIPVLGPGARPADGARRPAAGARPVAGALAGTVCSHYQPETPDPAVRTILVGFSPGAQALDALTHRLFVVNTLTPNGNAQGAVSVIDTVTDRVRATRPLSPRAPYVVPGPHSIAVDEQTNRVFVLTTRAFDAQAPSTATSVVNVLDATSGVLLRAVPLDHTGIALAADARSGHVFVLTAEAAYLPTVTGFVYISNPPLRPAHALGMGRVAVLDARTGAAQGSVDVGQTPVDLAVDPDAGRVFVPVRGPLGTLTDRRGVPYQGPLGPGTVSVLDTVSATVLATTTVGLAPSALTVDARSGRIFVLNGGPGAEAINPPIPAETSVSVLDAATGATVRTVAIDNLSSAVTVNETANRVYLSTYGDLVVLDATTGARLPTRVDFADPTEGLGGDLAVHAANAYPLASDERRGRVVLVNDEDPLRSSVRSYAFVVDARSGRVLTDPSHPVGYDPRDAVIDERTGRVFLLNRFADCPLDAEPSGSVSIFSTSP